MDEIAITGLTAINDSPTLLGGATAFTATITTGNNVTYTWSFGDGTSGSGTAQSHEYSTVGTYVAVVTAVNSRGTLTKSVTVNVNDVGITGLQVTSSGVTVLGNSTRFTASVSVGSNVVYTWNFGDGNNAVGAKVTHNYAVIGNYTASVTATNNAGSANKSTSVVVKTTEEFLPPTAVHDIITTAMNVPIGGNALTNDQDPQASPLTLSNISAPQHGDVTFTANGLFTYSPDAGYIGIDSFDYTVSNGHALVASAKIIVRIEEQGGSTPILWTPNLAVSKVINQQGFVIKVNLPADVYTRTMSAQDLFFLNYTPVVSENEGETPNGFKVVGLNFLLKAYLNDEELVHYIFGQPLLLEITYPITSVEGIETAELTLLRWNEEGEQWDSDGIDVVAHDLENRRITVAIHHLTEFGLFGKEIVVDDPLLLFIPNLISIP